MLKNKGKEAFYEHADGLAFVNLMGGNIATFAETGGIILPPMTSPKTREMVRQPHNSGYRRFMKKGDLDGETWMA